MSRGPGGRRCLPPVQAAAMLSRGRGARSSRRSATLGWSGGAWLLLVLFEGGGGRVAALFAGHSYWSASRTFSRDARLAGRIAARIPARIATTTKAASDL